MWYYDRLGQPISVERWSQLLHEDEGSYKRVAEDQVGPYWVSTVWLGLDHGFNRGAPVIFETMVFATSDHMQGLGPDMDCRRYSTEDEARAGHDETVTLIRATTADASTWEAERES